MQTEETYHVKWLWIGLAIMPVLIGAGVFLSILLNGSAVLANPGSVWAILGPVIGFSFLFFWIFTWAGHPASRRYWRRRYWRYGPEDDEALQVLRARYARGEITKEQLDQMTRDLEQHSMAY